MVRTVSGAVHIRGGAEEMIRANLELRTAGRVLVPVAWGRAANADQLYRLARSYRWGDLIRPTATIAVNVTAFPGSPGDARFCALRIKDGVVDVQRTACGRRSSVDRRRPDYRIVAHFDDDRVILSLDGSGRPLHERGYRREAGEAPLRENLAAGLLMLAGWDGRRALLDPFCGSGTIAIEAAMIALDRAPGSVGRSYAFEKWPWIDREEVSAIRELVTSETTAGAGAVPVVAADIDAEITALARRNAERAGVADAITFVTQDFFTTTPADVPPGSIVTNPPFGERLDIGDPAGLYRRIAGSAGDEYSDWDVNVLVPESIRRDDARPGARVYNGGIACMLARL